MSKPGDEPMDAQTIASTYGLPIDQAQTIANAPNRTSQIREISTLSNVEGKRAQASMARTAEERRKDKTKLSASEYRFFFFPWYLHHEYQLRESVYYTPRMLEYFESLKAKGINLSEYQKAWYAQKYAIQKDALMT